MATPKGMKLEARLDFVTASIDEALDILTKAKEAGYTHARVSTSKYVPRPKKVKTNARKERRELEETGSNPVKRAAAKAAAVLAREAGGDAQAVADAASLAHLKA